MFNQNKIKMRDLFQNPEMSNVFPQFTKDDKLQNVYSFDWVDKKVKEYLKSALNAQIVGDSIIVNGKKENVLKDVQRLKWTIEAFFNNLPSITKNIRRNTEVIMPCKLKQLKTLQTQEQKLAALNLVLDNLNYNPDFKSLNSVKVYNTKLSFNERQVLWQEKVGYNRRRKWQK